METTLQEEGVSEEVEQAEVEAPFDPRIDMMNKAAQKVRRADEEEGERESLEDTESVPPETADEPALEADSESEEAAETTVEETLPERRVLKVNGVDVEMTQEEIEEAAQKWKAGDNRLQQASELYKRAKALEQAQVQPEPEAKPEVDITSVADKIAYGTAEEIAEALETIRQPAQPATTDDVAQMVQDQVWQTRLSEEHNSALREVSKDFSNLAQDQIAMQVAGGFAQQEVAKDLVSLGYAAEQVASVPPQQLWERHAEARRYGLAVRDYAGIYRAAAEQTDARLNPKPVGKNVAERKAAKSQLQSQPKAASASATPTPAKKKSSSDVVEQMKKMRGQA